MPHANSITSRPRLTSPSASPVTLPCSSVSRRAMSCWCLSTSWRNANRILVRRASDTERHVCDAFQALSMASSTTLGVANATCAWTSPVAGLNTSPCRSACLPYALPSIQCVIVFAMWPEGLSRAGIASRVFCGRAGRRPARSDRIGASPLAGPGRGDRLGASRLAGPGWGDRGGASPLAGAGRREARSGAPDEWRAASRGSPVSSCARSSRPCPRQVAVADPPNRRYLFEGRFSPVLARPSHFFV